MVLTSVCNVGPFGGLNLPQEIMESFRFVDAFLRSDEFFSENISCFMKLFLYLYSTD